MDKKRSLFGRVVDAHTSGKLRRLHSSHSLSIDGHSRDDTSHVGHSPTASPAASPRPHHKAADDHHKADHRHTTVSKPDATPYKSTRKKMDSEAPGSSGLSDAIKAEMTHILLEAVSKCSRQKMRYILMTLRRLGGVDGYMSYADFTRILQDNGLNFPSTASGMVLSNCSTSLGVDSEKVWKLLMEVHSHTDRDSVRARKSLHMRTPIISVFADPGGDRELLERIETELLAAGAPAAETPDAQPSSTRFDMDAFKTAVLALDKLRQGHVPNTQLVKVCRDYGFPVKGDLLKSLFIRCDDDNNGKISHRELFVLLDKAYDSAVKINPRLFHKPDESAGKKKVDTGKLLEDGAVTQMARPTTPKAKTNSPSTVEAGESYGTATPGESVETGQALLGLPEEQTGKGPPKGKVGRLKGFLGRKKTSGSLNVSGDQMGNSSLDLRSNDGDNRSMASSIFSAVTGVSRATTNTGLYNQNRELTSNGLAERPINPVVRKIADQKLVLWPPDEYFDSITPKLRYPKLEWVYGYSGFAHRGNIHLHWDEDGEDANNPNKIRIGKRIVYFVGLVAVVYDLSSNIQAVYTEHDGLIQCISVSGDGKVAASGQAAVKETLASTGNHDQILAGIRIWSINSLKTLHIIKANSTPLTGPVADNAGDTSGHWATCGVVALCFTKDNESLVVLDEGVPTANTSDAPDTRSGQYRVAPTNKAPMRALTIWSVDTGHLVVQKPCTDSAVICGLKTLQKKENMFVIFGRSLMEMWRIIPSERRAEFVRQYVFGNIPKPSIVTTIIELQEFGQLVSGDSDGNVILWSDEMRPKTVLHSGNKIPVFSVCQLNDNQVAAGSRDGKIVILGIPSQLPQQNTGSHGSAAVAASAAQNVTIGKLQLAEEFGGVRVLLPVSYQPSRKVTEEPSESSTEENSNGNGQLFTVLIGTTANCILKSDLPTLSSDSTSASETLTVTTLTAGHFDRVTSLSAFSFTEEIPPTEPENAEEEDAANQPFASTLSPPSLSLAVTVGMDGNVNCYDLQAHSVRWRVFLKDSMLSSVDGFPPFLALGTSDGKLKVFKIKEAQLSQLFQANVGQGRVSCVKFSPDGSRLAVASQDSEIYIYRFLEQDDSRSDTSSSPTMAILGKFDKHDFPPVSIDWSRNPARDDHYVIHSNSYQFENFLWDAESLDYLEESHFYRNVKWHTQSCIYGFPAVTSVTSENTVDGTVICTEVTPTLDMVVAVTSDLPINDRPAQVAGDGRGNKTVTRGSATLGLYSYPNAKSQINHQHRTPSTAISAIKFTYVNNQLYLLCVHDSDGIMTQWSLQ